MKSSFASRYANACEGKFQFRLRQDRIAPLKMAPLQLIEEARWIILAETQFDVPLGKRSHQ
jgi:hypothetical protein